MPLGFPGDKTKDNQVAFYSLDGFCRVVAKLPLELPASDPSFPVFATSKLLELGYVNPSMPGLRFESAATQQSEKYRSSSPSLSRDVFVNASVFRLKQTTSRSSTKLDYDVTSLAYGFSMHPAVATL